MLSSATCTERRSLRTGTGPSPYSLTRMGAQGDVFARRAPSLGTLRRVLGDHIHRRSPVSRHVPNAAWVATGLSPIFRPLSEARHPTAQSEPVTRENARRVRDA